MTRLRRSITSKVVLPVVATTGVVVVCLNLWTAHRVARDFDQASEARARSAFLSLERAIRASGGSSPGAVAAMKLDDEIVDAVVVAGDDGAVVAATSLQDRYQRLDNLDDREAADDLTSARREAQRVIHFERADTNGGDADLIHVFGRLATPVETKAGTDYETAAAHIAIDVSSTRSAIAARARVQFVASLLGALSIALVALLSLRAFVTTRLRRLAGEVAAVAADAAELDPAGYGPDEVGQVAQELARAFDTIAQRGRELAESNAWLEEEMARRQAAEAETRHQARHDALTGLANRVVAHEFATAGLAIADFASERRLAALHVNLDRFKVVNDSLGHDAGDRVLQEQARRLGLTVAKDDLVARISGDEFLVLVEDRTESEVTALAGTLVETLEFPVELGGGNDVFGSASIGVAMALPGDDAESLFRRVGMALTRAKQHGRARYEWFDAEMQAAVEARAELEVALRYAIEDARPGDSELELHYQPIVDLGAARVRGFESLVRWRRDGVLVPPGEFIELAEETGLIVPLGTWILKEAMSQAGRWQQMFPDRPPVVTINVSGHQLSAGGVPSLVRAALTANKVDPAYVTIELTESVLLDDVERAVTVLNEIRDLGVKLAADDFGTGYSSLTYLRQFPFDVVKVDQSFVRNLGDDAQDSTIVAAVIAMAKALGLRVVCEGVETPAQLAGLVTLGADDGQGWFFAKALTVDLATRVFAEGLEVLASDPPAGPSATADAGASSER